MKVKMKKLVSCLVVGVIAISDVIASITTASFNPNNASTTFIMPDHPVTLKATSLANTYTVTVIGGRGIETVSGDGTYQYNQDVTIDATMKAGYENLTWEGDMNTLSFVMPAQDVTMTASATPITYSITYDAGIGTISGQKTTYNVEEGFSLPDPTRTGYDFVGWSGTNLTTPTSGLVISTGTYGDLNYEAVWSAKGDVTYKVHHYIKKVGVNEYEENSVDTYNTGIADGQLILADFAKTDIPCMTYTGGSLTMSTGGLANAVTTTTVLPDGSRDIYLYYSRNVHTLTLTKDTGISTVQTQGDYECGATVSINATPATGYRFYQREVVSPIGWNPNL